MRNGIDLGTLRYRERAGWDKIDALVTPPNNQQKATDQQIVDCEKMGMTIRRSAYFLGISKTALQYRIKKLGINWRGKGEQFQTLSKTC